jgi:hypothetical protein
MPPGAALQDWATSLALFVIIVRFTSAAFAAGDPARNPPPIARRICLLLNGSFRERSVPNLPPKLGQPCQNAVILVCAEGGRLRLWHERQIADIQRAACAGCQGSSQRWLQTKLA